MDLMKSDKLPAEAFKTSKGKDKEAFLKWMVTQALQFGVQNFKAALREEILEYLAEHPTMLLTADFRLSESSACKPTEVVKDSKELEEELWLQKYENLISNVEKKQTEFEENYSTKIGSHKNVKNVELKTNEDQTISSVEKAILPRQPLTSYDCVPMELSDDDETNKAPDVGQSTGLAGLPLLYNPDLTDHRNQHQTQSPDVIVHYGLNNLHLEQNQTPSPSLYVPYEHLPFNIQHPPNPNLVMMGNNMQPPLNLNPVPPVAPTNIFIPPLPQEESVLQPETSDKMKEILRLEELKKKKVMQINLLFNKFKAQQAARAVTPLVKEPLGFGRVQSGSTGSYNMNNLKTMTPVADSGTVVPPLPLVSTVPVAYGTITLTNNDTKNMSTTTESKKTWAEKNMRTNLIDVSKIHSSKTVAIESNKPQTKIFQGKTNETISITEKTTVERPPGTEQKDSLGTTEIMSHASRAPSIILTNDVTIPASVYTPNKMSEKEQKQLNWRPPTITLLNGKWTYVEQNEERAFRLIYNKWILMQKDETGKWQPMQDDFVKNYSCWKKHFPSYNNEILQHVLSASCLKSFVKTTFDSIPDPVTYWDFPASVPHDLRPPQLKELCLERNTYRISVTPGSGFGFISVHGKWVLLAENEHNQWVIMRQKGKYIAWLDGKWTCNAYPKISPPTIKISEKDHMPKLGLFSKKWVTLPTDRMTCKLLFGYWVMFRKNDFGRWNVARDDFANAFTCRKKHFPGDRESVPNPKLATWKEPPNFHTAELACLPTFDSKIFDSIGFPVTSYHFSPTVPKDLRPPKRYLILNREIRRYVEKNITPDSKFGFVSVNGQWEIREKTEEGTWIPVEGKCPETQSSSDFGGKNILGVTSIDKQLVDSSKKHPANDTCKKIDGIATSLDEPQLIEESKSSETCRSSSKTRWDEFADKEPAKPPGIHHVKDSPKAVDGATSSGDSKSLPIAENTSSEVSKNQSTSKTRSNSPKSKEPVKSVQTSHVENSPKKVDVTTKSREGGSLLSATSTSSEDNKNNPSFKKHSAISEGREPVKSAEVQKVSESALEREDVRHVEKNTSSVSSKNVIGNIEFVKSKQINKDVDAPKKGHDVTISPGKIRQSVEKHTSSESHKRELVVKIPIGTDNQPDNTLEKSLTNSDLPTRRFSSADSLDIAGEVDDKTLKESACEMHSSLTAEVKSGKILEKKVSDDARPLMRLKTLNSWKKTFQLIPAIPKLTLLKGEWVIISDNPQLKFHQRALENWQLLELNSDGQWKPLKDDFTLAKEKSKDVNNLEDYMSFINDKKFDSICIPVIHSDFPSSVPNKFKPPLVMEYGRERIEINANSGYACLSIERNWILVKQDDAGNWVSVDDEFKIAIKEKLKNAPVKYLSNHVMSISKKGNLSLSSNRTGCERKLSTSTCAFLELITGDISDTVVKPVTHWDVDGPEEEKPPKFALTEADGKKQWSGIRPNSGLGFVLEDDVWVLVKQTEFKEWNEYKLSSNDGFMLGYFLVSNRWITMRKYILGGKWEPLFDYKSTPCTYWDCIGPEEEKPPRNVFFDSQKISKSIHKNCKMGFLKKDDTWILMEYKNDKWSAIKNGEYEYTFKLVEGMWEAVEKNSDGKWTPVPVACPKLINYWNFNGLSEYAPPRRIIFEENETKSSKIINDGSGMGFLLEGGIWVLVKEGSNGEHIHVKNLEKYNGEIGFEGRNGKFKIIKKDESGNWIRSKDISEIQSNTSKNLHSLENFSFDGKFRNATPLTYYGIPRHISEHLKPPKYGLVPSLNCDLKWESIRINSGYGFIFENNMWLLMKWVFGRGWVLLEELISIDISGYKAIDGRWVPMKKENEKWLTLFDPFSTPRVVGQCFGSPEDKPPFRVPVDATNIIDVTFDTKMGFLKDSCVWILMKQQEDDTWKKFVYFDDSEGTYGYRRVDDSFRLVKKSENENWCCVYWNWNTNMWNFVPEKTPTDGKQKTNESSTRLTPNRTNQDNIVNMKHGSKSYVVSLKGPGVETIFSVDEDSNAPAHIECGVDGSLKCIRITRNDGLSFIKRGDIWIMAARDAKGWFIPNNRQGYKLIDNKWVVMKNDDTRSWLPTFDPISTPWSFCNTNGVNIPRRVVVHERGVTKWMDTACNLNLGFIQMEEAWIVVKRREGDWEIMKDELEESSTLAFEMIDYRWKRVKKNELGQWIPCSKQITLPVLDIDICGPEEVSPPKYIHLVDKYGRLILFNCDGASNVGFEQEDGVWIAMQCHDDFTWSRHAEVYNDEGVYGCKYINNKYKLMRREKGRWIVKGIVKKKNKLFVRIRTLKKRKRRKGASRLRQKRKNAVMYTDNEKDSEVKEFTDNEIPKLEDEGFPTTTYPKGRIMLKSSEIPISYDDCPLLPEYLKPPIYITMVQDGIQKNVKVTKNSGRAFIKKNDMWVYVERESNQWFVLNAHEGYKLIDNRYVLMKKEPNGSWIPAYDSISTPRTALDTLGTQHQPPRRVIVCDNGRVKWMNTVNDTNLGFVKEKDAWILMKRDSNGQWTEGKDEFDEESRLCFKLIDYKWQRAKKNSIGEWIPCTKQPLLPVTHNDIIGPQEARPPTCNEFVGVLGKKIREKFYSHVGFILEDDVWIVMHRRNLDWSVYENLLDQNNTYGFKRITGEWTLMMRHNDKWLSGMKTNNKWIFPGADEQPEATKELSVIEMEVAELNRKYPPKTFKQYSKIPVSQRPPECLALDVNGALRRVWFLHEGNYRFQKYKGMWILMQQDGANFKMVQNTTDGLLGYKIIDYRWVVMKKNGESDWICTFNPFSTPRTFYESLGPKFKIPPLRIILNEDGVYRWKIVSDDNGLGFVKEIDMWILMQRQPDRSWTKFRENSKVEEIGFKIVDYEWTKFKRCLNGIWTPCAQVCLPLLCCDFPVFHNMIPPRKLFYISHTPNIKQQFIKPESGLGFQLEDGAWVLMKCEENGTWSKVNLFPEQKRTVGYIRKDQWEIVMKDSNNEWKVVERKSGPNSRFLDFNDEGRAADEPDEPLAKKRCLELTETELSKTSSLDNSKCSSPAAELEKEAPLNSSTTEILEENYVAMQLETLLSKQTPMTWKDFRNERCEKQPPNNIVIKVNGAPKRISLSVNRTEMAFLKDDDVWVVVRKHIENWKSVHSETDGFLGYKLTDYRWVIMKKERGKEWQPTFDPIKTPRNHFDSVGPLDGKPPIRVIVNENGIYKWKVVVEENGLGFIKHEDIWILMRKIDGSWVNVTEGPEQEIIGYQIKNFKWTKVARGKDGVWKVCTKASLPSLHWDYVCRDKTIPPKVLPVRSSTSQKMACEVIRVDSGKGFVMEDGAWILKQCKGDGTWKNVDLIPGHRDLHGLMYRQGWKIVKKGEHEKWIEIKGLYTEEGGCNMEKDTDIGKTADNVSLQNKNVEVVQPTVIENISCPESLKDSSAKQIPNDPQLSGKTENTPSLTKFVSTETAVTYYQFRNEPYEKRPPQSVFINIDGTPKRILLTQQNTNMGFQKQDDVWILMERQDKVWKAIQSTVGGLLGFKLLDNRWVIMRNRKENDWIPAFDPTSTPRSFFDTVGRRDTRPPIRVVINKNGVDRWQIISEEYGFGFTRQGIMWVLMKKKADDAWVEFQDDSNAEIVGYNLVNCKWARFKRNKNGMWSCYPEVELPVLHWDFVNGDHVAPPESMCNCCEAQDNKDIKACLGPGSRKGFQLEDDAWVPMECAEDGTWSKLNIFPGQDGLFGYMNSDGWKIVKRDRDGRWKFVTKNDQGVWVFHDLEGNEYAENLSTDMRALQESGKTVPSSMEIETSSSNNGISASTDCKSESLEKKLTQNESSKQSSLEELASPSMSVVPISTINCGSSSSFSEVTQKICGMQKTKETVLSSMEIKSSSLKNAPSASTHYKSDNFIQNLTENKSSSQSSRQKHTSPSSSDPPISTINSGSSSSRTGVTSKRCEILKTEKTVPSSMKIESRLSKNESSASKDCKAESLEENLSENISSKQTSRKKNASPTSSVSSISRLNSGSSSSPMEVTRKTCEIQKTEKKIPSATVPSAIESESSSSKNGPSVSPDCKSDSLEEKLSENESSRQSSNQKHTSPSSSVPSIFTISSDSSSSSSEVSPKRCEGQKKGKTIPISMEIKSRSSADGSSVSTNWISESVEEKHTANVSSRQSSRKKGASSSRSVPPISTIVDVSSSPTEITPKKCGIQETVKTVPPSMVIKSDSSKNGCSAPNDCKSEYVEEKPSEKISSRRTSRKKYASPSSSSTAITINTVSSSSRTEVIPKKSLKNERSDLLTLLPALSPTDCDFPDMERKPTAVESSETSLDTYETNKLNEVSKKNSSVSFYEHAELDDLLPPLTPKYLHTLPTEVDPIIVSIKADKSTSDSSRCTSTNSKRKLEFKKEEPSVYEPQLNSVELYLAANPSYELSCPKLQNLLREFRPRDKPNKLIRRKFRLGDGNKVLLTIPKGLPENLIENQNSNSQELNAVESYLATHPPSEWASPKLEKILCEFEAADLKVSKRPCRYEFLFPDGAKRSLSIPRKTDEKNNATKILAAEIANILKNYEKRPRKGLRTKRKLIEDSELPTKVTKKLKGSKSIKNEEICEDEAEMEYIPRKSKYKKPGPKSKTCRK